MRVTIPARAIAKVSEKDGSTKYACIANEKVVTVLTNTEEGRKGLEDSMNTGAEVSIGVWVDDTSIFTYNYKRKEK